ncbi:UDP-glucose 4-epimerase GalE [Actimicrobium sp. CCI2.3]|uniref:UDP-glucose 4-epimerase GalE n=1 Tax=Actimicrobium sp. CCI2.3 TaxID=3048616 RepID=UPI002AB46A4B|nr:UDP-glucose 4-epimerase GalE [Actimicrobium sp. CCI2.3]MDY7575763.1 UDP-glucose 4-epimerase GalE [Actimicrobium sp. CCI2.3]MEB0023708.1 UDP-glucose 4-epimerase GalE [Actimicrobium sp. CCI2.3]
MTSKKTILVTGAAGFIGSHTCVELLTSGYDVIALDNLCNSSSLSLERVHRIAGHPVFFHEGDVRDRSVLRTIFSHNKIDAVIHFAGLKAVGESVAKPLMYYDNNVGGTVVLLEEMQRAGVHCVVFSSSATVYGDPESVPIREDATLSATNPYGRSKLMVEQLLGDLAKSDPTWAIGVLRYFNPVGAHASGLIGEDPRGVPNNLMPYVAQVAVGRLKQLSVYGNDYPTVDGTGVRDYIHVVDLAIGHVAALRELFESNKGFTVNLGTGDGYSVLEVVSAFELASARKVPYQITARRPGDIAKCFSDASKAQALLGWKAERGIAEMCADHWRWQSNNPQGFVA